MFALVRDRKVRTSKALWLAVLWLGTGGSRNLGEWLNFGSAQGADRYLEGNPLDRVYLFGLIALGTIVLLGRMQKVRTLLRANTSILLYFAYCGVSVLWSDYADVSFKRWIRSLGDIVMILLVLTDPDWLAALKRLYVRVGFVLLPVSVLFIRYFPEFGRSYSRGGAPAWSGVTTDKNALGMISMIFGLAFTWSFVQVWRSPRGRVRSVHLFVYGSFAAMAAWLVLKSNSATSLACWLVAASIMLLTTISSQARRPAVVHVLVLGVLFVVVSSMFLNTGTVLVQTLGRDSTFTGRTAIWSAALPLVPNPILGAGFESFWMGPRLSSVERSIHQDINQAHNGYIEIYLNLGWIGVLLLGVLLVRGYVNIVAAVHRQAEGSTLMLAYFVVATMYNFSEAGFKMMMPVWICVLFAVTVAPKLRQKSNIGVRVVPVMTEAEPADWLQHNHLRLDGN